MRLELFIDGFVFGEMHCAISVGPLLLCVNTIVLVRICELQAHSSAETPKISLALRMGDMCATKTHGIG